MRMAAQFDRERLRLQSVIADDQARLQHQATHDALTDLPNRALLLDRLTQALAERERTCCAVMFVDLDRFKDINDSAGHSVGDEVLSAVARRLVEGAVRLRSRARRSGRRWRPQSIVRKRSDRRQ